MKLFYFVTWGLYNRQGRDCLTKWLEQDGMIQSGIITENISMILGLKISYKHRLISIIEIFWNCSKQYKLECWPKECFPDYSNICGKGQVPYSRQDIFFISYKQMVFYIPLRWKGLQRTNTQAYWAHSKVTKEMKCCGVVNTTSEV